MPAWFSKSETEPCLNPMYATRTLSCPHCGETVEAAVRAVTLRCRSCHKQLQFQDAVYSRSSVENVSTLGQVRIHRKAALRGKVDCGSLLVQGALDGNVNVRGEARIDAKATVSGTLSVRRLLIEPGGSFRGTLSIGEPGQAGQAQKAQASNSHVGGKTPTPESSAS